MKLKVNETIRMYRKKLNLTQEQLAEAVGVTVGAVSKWESGLSSPDILMLPILADFFEISIDVLLGYQLTCRTAESSAEKINELCLSKSYQEGMTEAEKALQRFPNHFEVVYKSAELYQLAGVEQSNHDFLHKALTLFEKACTLISQNTNPLISELRIRSSIGEVYVCLGEVNEAIEYLKKFNACGVNNAIIGFLLTQVNKQEEALPYLSDSLLESLSALLRTTLGLFNCYNEEGKFSLALDVLLWMSNILKGLQYPNRVSYIDKALTIIYTCCAISASSLNDSAEVENYLREAIARAKCFDASPDYSPCSLKFYGGKDMSMGDDFGESALQGMEQFITTYESENTLLLSTWRRLINE